MSFESTMSSLPPLVIPGSLNGVFGRRVVPILESKGWTVVHSDIWETVTETLDRPLRIWAVTVSVPTCGAVVELRRSGPVWVVEDAILNGKNSADDGESPRIRITSSFGMKVEGEPCEDELTASCSEQRRLLIIHSDEVVFLAEVLPGFDLPVIIECWAREKLPLKFMTQRPSRVVTIDSGKRPVLRVDHDDCGFAIECSNCNGTGERECEKCQGTGIHKPETECPPCGGRGSFDNPCKNCKGSGRSPRSGGTCGLCEGTGIKTRQCGPCNGTGRWAQQDCNPCNGSGAADCRSCHGTCWQEVDFNRNTGVFKRKGESLGQVDPGGVVWMNWGTRQPATIEGGGGAFLQELAEFAGGSLAFDGDREIERRQYQQTLKGIRGCLQKSIDWEDQNRSETETIRVSRPSGSLKRAQRGVVYEFPVATRRQSNKKQVTGDLFPVDTRLRLYEDVDGELREISSDIWSGRKSKRQLSAGPTVVGTSGSNRKSVIQVRFPATVKLEELPEQIILVAEQPRPPELSQKNALGTWSDLPRRNHPILNAVLCAGVSEMSPPVPQFFNSGVEQQESQRDALMMALADNPLLLIKGPPGTGKTTVITEIVRQLLDRGQRVLVTSQTHQAVRNVLENLHDVGGVRMVRHALEEKLQGVEHLYWSGGAGQRFHKEVGEKTKGKIKQFDERVKELAGGILQVEHAREAAERLAEERAVTRRLQQQAVADRDNRLQALNEELESRTLAASNRSKDESRIEAQRRAVADKKLKTTLKRLKRYRAIQATTAESFRKRRGHEPERVPVSPSHLSRIRDVVQAIVNRFLPDFVVSARVLEERFSFATEQIEENEPRETLLRTQLREIDKRMQEIAEELQIELSGQEHWHTGEVDVVTEACDAELERTAACLQRVESSCRATQATAVTFARQFSVEIHDDSEAKTWKALGSQAKSEQQLVGAKLAFTERWFSDVESDPECITRFEWDQLQVFFSTCVGVASWRDFVEMGEDAVDVVIVDEAGHATIGETLLPLQFGKRAILIGDEMQLPPLAKYQGGLCGDECPAVVPGSKGMKSSHPGRSGAFNPDMPNCWLECSFFERLTRIRAHVPRIMLDVQFRMHPDIGDFVGEMFYPEGLKNGVEASDRQLQFAEFTRAVCMVPTSAYRDCNEDFLEPGYRNQLEARIVRKIIERAESELESPQKFGIITPYRGQVAQIQKELRDILPDLKSVELSEDDVASVDRFQGSERDVIVVSFTRSPKSCPKCSGGSSTSTNRPCDVRYCGGKGFLGTGLSFARDLRRLNVAFSRARKMLILVGNIDALTDPRFRGSEEGRMVLERFEGHVQDRGKILHVWETE